tara:strand:- start:221 stop:445 length:225 start_codon:yes stop_codon:yes gene_type:complete
MQKTYFHYPKPINENERRIKPSQIQHLNKKRVVDINNLLNRVKVNKKKEIKRKIILFSLISLAVLGLGIMVTLL